MELSSTTIINEFKHQHIEKHPFPLLLFSCNNLILVLMQVQLVCPHGWWGFIGLLCSYGLFLVIKKGKRLYLDSKPLCLSDGMQQKK